jgi:quercetin dioxygenase-like cupin family protein
MCSAALVYALLAPDEMQWATGPPTLPAGVKIVVIEGDPREAGAFTMRLTFPAGTRVEPHFHAGVEHATVLAGAVSWGIGETFTVESLRRMPVGSFILIPAGLPHYVVEEDTVIQAHGIGPWQTTYANRRAL